MPATGKIAHVAPNGRVVELSGGGEKPFLARTHSPAHRERYATLEEAIAHMRAVRQALPEPGILTITGDIVAEMERVIAVEEARGTRPDDGTEAGRIMASELKWIEYQRGQLANARGEMHSWYDPLAIR